MSAEDGRTVQWSTGQTGQVAWHSVELEQSQAFNEAYNQANDGIAFYAMSLVSVYALDAHGTLTGRVCTGRRAECRVADMPGHGVLRDILQLRCAE